MSVYDIQGRDCVFQLKIGDDFLTVVCAKSFSINVATEMKDTTTVGGLGTGWWKEKRPRKLEYSITFNGTTQVLADANKPTIKTMLQNQVWFLPMDYRIIYEDQSSNVMVLLGRVYNASTVMNANPANLLDGTIELQGTGPIDIKDALPNPVNLRLLMVDDGTGLQVGKARLVLQDVDGNVVFQTDDLPQAVAGGYIEGPAFDITTTVESGQYYYTWYAITETDANLFHLDDPPGVTTSFASGLQTGTSNPTLHDFTAPREVEWSLGPSVPPPGCVPVQIVGSPTLPDAVEGTPYSYSFAVTGTAPYGVSNFEKPEWLNITVDNDNQLIVFSGTPNVTGTDITVEFDIRNCFSEGLVVFSDTIDVAAGIDLIAVDYTYTENIGANGAFRIYVNGVEIIHITASGSGSINVNPLDTVQTTISANSTLTTHLVVDESIVGNIYDTTTTGSQSFTITATATHDYTITADVSL